MKGSEVLVEDREWPIFTHATKYSLHAATSWLCTQEVQLFVFLHDEGMPADNACC